MYLSLDACMADNTFEKKINPDAIGLLPQERDTSEENKKETNRLESSVKPKWRKIVPRLTDGEFQQHLNADPKLKEAYREHQSTIERQKKATERVKNTGYFGTLWGGITGESGLDDLAKINEDTNAANTKFRNALDQNSGLSKELKQQLISYKSRGDFDVNAATAQASSDASERAENYAGNTIAVRNTGIGAWLVVGAAIVAPAVATAAVALWTTAAVATVLGTMAWWGVVVGMAGTWAQMLIEEWSVVYDATKDSTKNIAQIQNERESDILRRVSTVGDQYMKAGMTLPAAAAVGPGTAIAGWVRGTLLTGATTTAIGGSIGAVYGAGREEAKITLDAMRNPEPGKGRLETWIDKNKEWLPAIGEQTKEWIKYGAAFGLAMATPVGRPLVGSAGVLWVAEWATNTVENLQRSTLATGSDKIKAQNDAVLSLADTAFAGLGSKALLKATKPQSSSASPEPPITTRTNRGELDLWPKNGGKNIPRNPDTPVEGVDLPAAWSGMKQFKDTTWVLPEGSKKAPVIHTPRSEIDISWNKEGTRTTQMSWFDKSGNFRIHSEKFPNNDSQPNRRRIIKGTSSQGSSILDTRIPPVSKKKVWYTYEKKWPDGVVQARRENDGRWNGFSEVKKSDGSVNVRTYKSTPQWTQSSFKWPHSERVNISTEAWKKITYEFQNASTPWELPKASQTVRRPDGTVFKWETILPLDNSQKIRYNPTAVSSDLPNHLKTATNSESVQPKETLPPQKPATPPENLKKVTLDPAEELIKKRSLK